MGTLVVVAHPDDEVLGFGGSGAKFADSGEVVQCCILSGDVSARSRRPETYQLTDDIRTAQEILGFSEPILGSFPNIAMNTVPHLELVRFIELAMSYAQANVLVTHHPNDLNDDHRQVARAVMAAARLRQRNSELKVPPLTALMHMEVLSSTEWQFAAAGPAFNPDTYVELGRQYLARKTRALQAYRDVMRPFPHPRSVEAIEAQAVLRGAESGLDLAESFATSFRVLSATTDVRN